jgi:hypothetical protein
MVSVIALAIGFGRFVGVKDTRLSDQPPAGNHASLILDNQRTAIARIYNRTGAQSETKGVCLRYGGHALADDVVGHGLLSA